MKRNTLNYIIDVGMALFFILAALTGVRLRPRAALGSLLGGAGAALLWRVVQPIEVDALFVGLGVSLIVTCIVQGVGRRWEAE